jgi:hypothetical protein
MSTNNKTQNTSKNSSLNLMGGRLGLYGKGVEIQYVQGDGIADKVEETIEGLTNQTMILKRFGGIKQQDRMIKDKRRSLDKALLYSYQAATIKKVIAEEDSDNEGFESIQEDKTKRIIRALINPNKLKPDYDDKIISVYNEEGFKPGDVFKWEGTDTYWLIYLQDLTELAYFRGDIRKCSYAIKFRLENEDIVHETLAAVRGPVETKVNFIQKSGISVDEPNHTLNILMPKTEANVKYFRRYRKFYLHRLDEPFDEPEMYPWTCWRVEAWDDISTPGILEITAKEYYINEDEDNVAEGIAGGLKQLPMNLNKPNIEILMVGETFIKPKKEYTYTYKGLNNGRWTIDPKYPVKYWADKNDPAVVHLIWESSYSGQFELVYGNFTKTIVVESLF